MQSTGLISTNAKNTKAKSKVKAKSVRENRSKQRERERRECGVKGKPHKMPLKNFPNLEVELRPAGVPTETAKRRQSQSWIEKKHRENVEKNLICLRGWTTMVLYGATTLSVCLPFNFFYSIYVEVYWFVCQCKMIFGIWNLRVPHHFATGVSQNPLQEGPQTTSSCLVCLVSLGLSALSACLSAFSLLCLPFLWSMINPVSGLAAQRFKWLYILQLDGYRKL